jgi:predicted transcriptional regulator
MSKLSEKNIQKLKEQILSVIYLNHFNPLFTSQIANELIRDEEFVLKLLKNLKKEGIIQEINKNNDGKRYLARKKWLLKNKAYNEYKRLYEDQ